MTVTVRNVLISLLIGLVLVGTAYGVIRWMQRRPHHPRPKATPEATTPGAGDKGRIALKPYNVVLPLPRQGDRTWTAYAQSIEYAPAQGDGTVSDIVTLKGVNFVMLQQGAERVRIEGDEARVEMLPRPGGTGTDDRAFRAALTGNVRAWQLQDDLLLMADTLDWSSLEEKVHASRVRWQGMGFDHTADSGDFTTDLTRAHFARARTEYAGENPAQQGD